MPPDRLEGTAWRERREQTEREIATTAATLIAQMREREAQPAPVIEPGEKYRRFVRAMPFAPTPDQASAIRSVQQELAARHPMFRLACGDVGFGKTEVALHAAALAGFAGYQVAVAAPTTLLARQHLNVFRRRLSGFGLRIEPLIRSAVQECEGGAAGSGGRERRCGDRHPCSSQGALPQPGHCGN
jgi:transcription-repair coupling factor (superfamily II helicase)